MQKYIALFEEVKGKESYGVVFPDFPGCISAGDTFEEAMQMAHEALAGHVNLLKAEGGKIPAPRTLDQIKNTWEDWKEWEDNYDFVVGYVTLLPLKTSAKRVNIMLDETLLAQIDRVTKNRSSFLAEAARRMLGIMF